MRDPHEERRGAEYERGYHGSAEAIHQAAHGCKQERDRADLAGDDRRE